MENKKITLAGLEEMLKEGKIPPGIMEYDDMPSENEQKQSENKIDKLKKVRIVNLALGN
jgi:hypothetical protein